MLNRTLIATVAGLTLAGGLATVTASAAPTVAAAATVPSARLVSSAGPLEAVVTAPVGGDWSVRFVDASGTVLASVGQDAVALVTADGRVPADRVVAVSDDVVELGTADPALTASVGVRPDGDGTFAVTVTGAGGGITAVSLDLKAPSGERYLGMGERSDAVDHRGREVLNRVLDGPYTHEQHELMKTFIPAPGNRDRRDATYFPVPWLLSTSGYGVLVDNDEDSTFELATKAHPKVNRIVVQAARMDLHVFGGPTPALALSRMTALVGRQPTPSSAMVFGAWFQPRGDAAAEVDGQRTSGVPLSVVQTYTHYLPCGVQVTDRERAQTSALHARGVAVTTYFNPMVCQSYQPAYDDGLAADAFTRAADGSVLTYPYNTASHFEVAQVDFSSAAGRDYYQGLLQESVDDGYDGWMEDFGEYTPDDAVSADGTPGTQMHNRYVEQYHGTAREFEESAPRPLLRFQRSGWTDAIADSSIVWGGDPTTTWGFDGISSSVRQGLTMGTSGVSIWGPDIGGFFTTFKDPQQTTELLNRWIEYGAFTGVMRLQSGGILLGVPDTRPKVDDPAVAPVWKRYTRLRTMLYPYIAGSQDAYDATGLPLMRHLALVHPDDATAVRADDEYLFGQDLLVAPVIKQGALSRKVYLPEGRWLALDDAWSLRGDGRFALRKATDLDGRRTVTAKAPIDTIPLYLRVGAVVPMLPRSVDTLSDYGDDVVRLADRPGRRTLLAAPARGRSTGVLGAGETLVSRVSRTTWTLRLAATTDRTYDVRATLAGMRGEFVPCGVVADGARVPFRYVAGTRVLTFRAGVAASGTVTVTACR